MWGDNLILAIFLIYCCGILQVIADVDENLHLFGTKTKYENRIPHADNSEILPWIKENIPKYLNPIFIDATLRHGTRFPSTKRVDIWQKIMPRFQQYIGQSNSNEFSQGFKNSVLNWTSQFPNHTSYLLSSVGWQEHVNLAQKYYSMMPELWSRTLLEDVDPTSRSFHVFSSRKIRSRTSARAFVTAIQLAAPGGTNNDHHDLQFSEEKCLPESNSIDKITNTTLYGRVLVKVDDNTMRFFDNCPKYLDSVDNNATAEHEFEGFFQSKTFSNLVSRIPGIENEKEIYYVYQLCALEMAIFNQSVWCRLFNEEDFLMLDYASDLKHYYRTGHGYAVNYEQACILLESILKNIVNLQKKKPMAVLRFGHAETLIPLVSLLEFYQDPLPLKSDNFEHHSKRAFRTARISPFSGNMAVVIYESPEKKLYISFVLNENILKPFGMDCYFCEFDSVKKILEKKVMNCHLVCETPDRGNQQNTKDEL